MTETAATWTTDRRLVEHVDRIELEHPPVPLGSVDFTVLRPDVVRQRFGPTLDYLARVELEVDRNVLELNTMLADPPDIDVRFYREVWHAQEIQHGLILDRLQTLIGRPPATTDTDSVSAKMRILGLLSHLSPVQDVVRMLYYLTGMSTERSAVVAYNRLHAGLTELGEMAVAETAIAPIRRQEPPHYAFYKLSAIGLAARLAPWQKWLTRRLRALSWGPVGANNRRQKADFGGVLTALGLRDDLASFGEEISRVERDLLWERKRGLHVPSYVTEALREAVALYDARHSRHHPPR
jgi:hypothetical protein